MHCNHVLRVCHSDETCSELMYSKLRWKLYCQCIQCSCRDTEILVKGFNKVYGIQLSDRRTIFFRCQDIFKFSDDSEFQLCRLEKDTIQNLGEVCNAHSFIDGLCEMSFLCWVIDEKQPSYTYTLAFWNFCIVVLVVSTVYAVGAYWLQWGTSKLTRASWSYLSGSWGYTTFPSLSNQIYSSVS